MMLRALFCLLLPVVGGAECIEAIEVKTRSVVVEKYGRGVGTGVVLDGQYILTAAHVVDEIQDETVWVRMPFKPASLAGALPMPSRVVKLDMIDDLALLKLQEPLDIYQPIALLHQKDVVTHMPVFLGAYAHGDMAEFGLVPGQYKAPARRSEGGPINSIYAVLENRTYGGDSGGGVYTCFGELMGIQIGNQAHLDKPHHIAAVAPGNIQIFLADFINLPQP